MRRVSKTKLSLLVAALLGVSVSGGVLAKEFPYFDGSWAQSSSDIKSNSEVTYGELDNGLRYAILPNRKPADRVSLYLVVQAGSLMETDAELGSAHYLEHMAFNGSKHFAPGELIPFFQREGMRFGADTNAHTSSLETVYKLNLASTDAHRIEDGLLMLRDVADGLTLSPHEVEQERGVIKAEKRARDSMSFQNGLKARAFLYPHSRLNRNIIGTDETLDRVTSESLRAFYEKWYVPSRMVVVVVGDIDSVLIVSQIKAQFGSLQKASPLPFVDHFGDTLTPGLDYLALTQPQPTVTLQWVGLFEPYPHVASAAQARLGLLDSIATIIVNRRLSVLREKDPTLMERARFNIQLTNARMPSTQVTILTTPERQKDALRTLRELLLSVATKPASDSEVAWAKKRVLNILEEQALKEKNLTHQDWANSLASCIIEHEVFTKPSDDVVRFKEDASSLTKEAINARLVMSVQAPAERILVTSPTAMTQDEVKALWDAASPQNALAQSVTTQTQFPYLPSWPDATSVTLEQKALPYKASGLTMEQVQLPNGWTVVLLPSSLEKNSVRLYLAFGEGLNPLPDDSIKQARLTSQLVALSGVGRLGVLGTRDELTSLGVKVKESWLPRYSMITGTSTQDKLRQLLEGVRTQYVDPHIDKQAREKLRVSLALSEASQNKTVKSILSQYAEHVLTGSRPQTVPLTVTDLDRLTDESAYRLMSLARQSGQHIVMVAGDFKPEDKVLIMQMAQALPLVKNSPMPHTMGPQVPIGLLEERVATDETLPKWSLIERWRVALPTDPEARQEAVMGYQLLASLLRERMRMQLREGASLTYSPQARFTTAYVDAANPASPYEGWLTVSIEARPKDGDKLIEMLGDVIASLKAMPPTEDELMRLKATQLTALKEMPQNVMAMERVLLMDKLRNTHDLAYWDQYSDWVKALSSTTVQECAHRMFSQPSARFIVKTKPES